MITAPRSLLFLAATGLISLTANAATITASASASFYYGQQYAPDQQFQSLFVNEESMALYSFVLPELSAGQSYDIVTFSIGTTNFDYSLPLTLRLLSSQVSSPTILPEYANAPSSVVQLDFITSEGVTTSTNLASHVNTLLGGAGGTIVFSIGGDNRSFTTASLAAETHANPALRPSLEYTVVPEPSTYGMIGAGALGAVALVRRRRRSKAA